MQPDSDNKWISTIIWEYAFSLGRTLQNQTCLKWEIRPNISILLYNIFFCTFLDVCLNRRTLMQSIEKAQDKSQTYNNSSQKQNQWAKQNNYTKTPQHHDNQVVEHTMDCTQS
jgi:hypothetical protein